MNTLTNESTVSMTTIACGGCGGVYAICSRRYDHDRENGKSWNCPYCKVGWGFAGSKSPLALAREKAERLERDAQFLREQRDAAQQRAAAAQRQASAARGVTTKIKNRVARGVCPCCNRTFQNLKGHMATKHPGYSDD